MGDVSNEMPPMPPAEPTDAPEPEAEPMNPMPNDEMDGGLGAGPQINGGAQAGADEISGIYNQLSATDKKAVKSYAESMLSRDEDKNANGVPDDEEVGAVAGAPMQETVIFTKSQLDEMTENFGPMADELDDRQKNRKKNEKKFKDSKEKSPFKSPKFK